MATQDQDELSEQVRAISSFLKGEQDKSQEQPRSSVADSKCDDPTSKEQSLYDPVQAFRESTTLRSQCMDYARTSQEIANMDKHDCDGLAENDMCDSARQSTVTPSSGRTCNDSGPTSDSATTPSGSGSSLQDPSAKPETQTNIIARNSSRDSGYASGVASPTSANGTEDADGHVPDSSLPRSSVIVGVDHANQSARRPSSAASPCHTWPQPPLQSARQLFAGSAIKPLLLSKPSLAARPSVITVELAAAARIYLETYFNELLCGLSPRERRMHHMENWLYKTKGLDFNFKQKYRAAFYAIESNHLRETRVLKAKCIKSLIYGDEGTKRSPPSLTCASDFQLLKVLGKGSFGTVTLVREKPNEHDEPSVVEAKQKQFYAMKVIRKSQMVRSGQEGHLRAERDFLVASEGSNWVVPLVESFQDVSNLYLVMEYMPGGDFLSLLVRENILDEAVSRFYIAEMILCVEEAHALQYIHRDIKPDNFLVSASGHLKISDFGLAFDGHWSHDSRYHSSTRYSLLQNLGIYVEGDETDQKKDASLNNPKAMSCSPGMMAGIEKHQRPPAFDAGEEPILH